MGGRHSRGMTLGGLLVVLAVGVGVVVIIVLNWAHTKKKTIDAPNREACDCSDLQLILNRQRLAEAAIKSIDELMAAQSAKNPNEMYSKDLYQQGKGVNQKALWRAGEGDELTGTADTPSSTCRPDVSKGTTPCMEESLRAHENVHQRECLKYKTKWFEHYQEKKTMLDYWKEDREGYEEEVKFLKDQFPKVMDKCKKPEIGNYIDTETKEEQEQRHAGSKRRVAKSVGAPI